MVELTTDVKKNLQRVKRIIGIYSGKGGVGKTTVAVNIAAFLAHEGYRVGLLDADIDCPNVTIALGIQGTLDVDMTKRIIPHEKYGIKVVSMASLQEKEDQAIIWRGPMLTDSLMKFLGMTIWGTLDYLLIDMPPGTSDVPLTIMNFLKPDGIILVTTPRSIAELDARKSGNLAKMTHVSVVGVIENMSGGIFGTGKGQACADALQVPFLGSIQFDKIFLTSIDEGHPAVLQSSEAREQVKQIIQQLQAVERHLFHETIQPRKGLLGKTKNLALDFKDEIIDRYKYLKSM